MTKTAKIFMNGRSQAVRLPLECRFDSDQVYVQKQGDKVILSATEPGWGEFFALPPVFEEDFFSDRADLPPQNRNDF